MRDQQHQPRENETDELIEIFWEDMKFQRDRGDHRRAGRERI